jgi:hypothetical protein
MDELQEYKKLFSTKINGTIREIKRINNGRNSRVFKILCDENQCYIAKIYYYHKNDIRNRLKTEFDGLSFLWNNGIRNIPKPLASDEIDRFCIYEYIEGETIHDKINGPDIDQAVQFIINLDKIKKNKGADSIANASEAFFSLADIIANIELRVRRIVDSYLAGPYTDEMLRFLEEDFNPLLNEIGNSSRSMMEKAGFPEGYILPFEKRTLSPSDFGLHNALRKSDGNIVFLDFEYFGWDDPAKLIIDFILHPGMSLSFNQKRKFSVMLVNYFNKDAMLSVRLSALYPLFGMKWCLILLNEFVMDDIDRRKFSGAGKFDENSKRKIQLQKAGRLFAKIKRKLHPNFDPMNGKSF